MAELTEFRSREAILTCKPDVFFRFITDIRNFRQFIPDGAVENWDATAAGCSMSVPPVGNVSVSISSSNPHDHVKYDGASSQVPYFSIDVFIAAEENGKSKTTLVLLADMNPFIKVIAAGPVKRMLDTLCERMEHYTGWPAD
ncbi:MAG: hypothetical protein U0X39_08865 [Bacteroidales bacterium]